MELRAEGLEDDWVGTVRMNPNQIHENLIGYVLDALEDDERLEVESRIAREPMLDIEMTRLRTSVQALRAAASCPRPKPGLAERTCQWIESLAACESHDKDITGDISHSPGEPTATEIADVPPLGPAYRVPSPPTAALDRSVPPRPPRRRFSVIRGDSRPAGESLAWSWTDVVAMAGVAVLLFVVLIPGIHSSRFQSRIVTCQDNLRQVGQSLAEYSISHGNRFPAIPEYGNLAAAGIYAPVLRDAELLPDPMKLLCPESSQTTRQSFQVPSVAEVAAMAPGPRLDAVRQTMGGSYAYSLGHLADGKYRSPENLQRQNVPLLADMPANTPDGLRSLHHGGIGHNVLFEDGHVRFVTTPTLLRENNRHDHLFLNDSGVVAAGLHRYDAVLGASHQSPIRLISNR